jgi:hypothetical protein
MNSMRECFGLHSRDKKIKFIHSLS